MVEALERHPTVRVALHYSGPAARLAARRAARRSSSGCGPSPIAARSRSWAAATASRSSRRCPSATGSGSSRRMADEVEDVFGRAAERRVAGRAGLGAGPAHVARRRRLRLDDPRRRALPGRRDPRGRPVGPVHHRGPGPPDHGLRDRAGAALPDPVPDGRGRHRLPARARHRGRVAGRDDGRRRREVRGVADDLGALLGRGRLGRAVLRRRSRRTPTG